MTTILILEGNSTAMVQQGKADALPFVKSFMALDPSVRVRVDAPYARPLEAADLEGVDGVVFTGSGVEWSTAEPEAEPLRAAMRQVFKAGLPSWGSCNGMQLAAVVLGGDVGASPKGVELGIAQDITLTEAAEAHPMMAGKVSGFGSPCVHRDEVQTLPEGAILMAGNAHSPVQAFVYEKDGVDFWGVQYHPECDALDLASWLRPKGAHGEMVADLETMDAAAAARLGTTAEEMSGPVRMKELANWLDHVKARAGNA